MTAADVFAGMKLSAALTNTMFPAMTFWPPNFFTPSRLTSNRDRYEYAACFFMCHEFSFLYESFDAQLRRSCPAQDVNDPVFKLRSQ